MRQRMREKDGMTEFRIKKKTGKMWVEQWLMRWKFLVLANFQHLTLFTFLIPRFAKMASFMEPAHPQPPLVLGFFALGKLKTPWFSFFLDRLTFFFYTQTCILFLCHPPPDCLMQLELCSRGFCFPNMHIII